MKPTPQPPQRVPVLTEVVVLPKAEQPPQVVEDFAPTQAEPAYANPPPPAPVAVMPARAAPASAPAAAPLRAGLDEAAIAQRVLGDLDKQLDLMFEHRLRETLTPLLTRMTDSLVREMRNQLAASLREMVARAVSLELERQQKR